MKGTEQYFPVVLFIKLFKLYKVLMKFEFLDKVQRTAIPMKALQKYFLEALFVWWNLTSSCKYGYHWK